MSLGLFDVVGPVMHGPSSNHTAGANRIGWLAGQLMGGTPKAITFGFHPVLHRIFAGHRTHVALLAGCLGLREYDEAAGGSIEQARRQGIRVAYTALSPDVDRNTMRVSGRVAGIDYCVNGISVGGGSLLVTQVNGVPVELDGNGWLLLFVLRPGTDAEGARQAAGRWPGKVRVFSGEGGGQGLLLVQSAHRPTPRQVEELAGLLGEGALCRRLVEPVVPFADLGENPPLFTRFQEWMAQGAQGGLLEAALEYERRRSLCTTEQIMEQALHIVDVIEHSMERGLQGDNPLIAGLCTGSDGRAMAQWARGGRSLTGEVLPMAMARALAMAEVSASGGLLVAVPTSGSAGTLPGTLFTVAQRVGAPRQQLAQAFLVAAAIGVVIGHECCFSGSTGGCQAEIGIGSAMAAGASVWLAGGSDEAVCHAAALAIKNTLGLVCDPPAPPVEVPCIKRNAMGAAVALMAAEMALAGIRSVVPPDDVVLALKDVQQRLPAELRCTCTGGLAAALGARALQQQWQRRLDDLREV